MGGCQKNGENMEIQCVCEGRKVFHEVGMKLFPSSGLKDHLSSGPPQVMKTVTVLAIPMQVEKEQISVKVSLTLDWAPTL